MPKKRTRRETFAFHIINMAENNKGREICVRNIGFLVQNNKTFQFLMFGPWDTKDEIFSIHLKLSTISTTTQLRGEGNL